ncbi:bumetanide-sensitive sodium-(potassium)-chloride cotransporter [Contarinia nasturtii]|uniref:bumetanide-sensitive sodium-(potassium)-chloride cotransporter n=1 Tax=Contarinia nasturtii TaxID=265458 RepID=UPI0012D478B9|nr:bumetanide-sensitive sodium-(potassium)-chloride cotransporter [Contarinia nasturtii]
MDPVELNVYGLYSKRNSVTCPAQGELKRKSSYGFTHLTREALPRLDNYRLSLRAFKRPSISLLHGEVLEHIPETAKDVEEQSSVNHSTIKLGWIVGVLIPCLLNIWGVMLFLRLSWVVAQAGIFMSLCIIAISFTVCVITTLSLSAISTNGEVKGGGIYYIISRTLGPEFGASVGIVFAFANAVAASMNTIGFCSSLNDLFKEKGWKIIDNDVNDIRIVGAIALAIMIIICAIGMEWETKAQNFLLAIIVAAIFNFVIGSIIGPSIDEKKISKGFIGFSTAVFSENWRPDYRFSEKVNQNFFSVFAIFFPSVTGLQAGANISGDLKDPSTSIPKGTLLALLISAISYAVFVVFAGGSAVRDASGIISDIVNGTLVGVEPHCLKNKTCEFGLHNSYTIMQLMSKYEGLIYAGCWAATLSTALTNLLSVPRLIQALGIDRIYPGLIFFSKGYGKHGEPYRGYVLTFFISLIFLLIAELNLIAPLISNFYLASYALINFCTFHAAFVKPLGWRPTFKYYNVWLSLFGFVLCVAIMFLIHWVSSLITFIMILALYLVVVYRKPDVNWGSTAQAQTYKSALTSTYRLTQIGDHVKNYRPQILVLAGTLQSRPPLVDLANLITKHNSLMIVGDVITKKISYKTRRRMIDEGQRWLTGRKIKAFYNIVEGLDFETGVRALIQTSGVGKLAPNILLMGYKSDWQTCNHQDLVSYFNVLHYAFSNRLSVAILRLPNGLDLSLDVEVDTTPPNGLATPTSSFTNFNNLENGIGSSNLRKDVLQSQNQNGAAPTIMHADSYLNIYKIPPSTTAATASKVSTESATQINEKVVEQKNCRKANLSYTSNDSTIPKELLNQLGIFHSSSHNGTIDVWWLYDDGGLTILIPYILSLRSQWSRCKIRIFALTNHQMELKVEEQNMAKLLAKLRIDYSCLIMLQDVKQKPKPETMQLHKSLLDGFNEGQESECVTEAEKSILEEKTNLQLRLRELLLKHSTDASLVVMSLPMPRQGAVSAALYLSWLEVLTKDMPAFLLVRGNQNSVLTFYS